jgi:hypothetical protein
MTAPVFVRPMQARAARADKFTPAGMMAPLKLSLCGAAFGLKLFKSAPVKFA